VSAVAAIANSLVDRPARKETARRLATVDLISYTKRMNPVYEPSQVHEDIAAFVWEAMTTPGFRGILIIPPRFGKSELASVSAPGFYLGHFPDKQIIAASHTSHLANDFSRQARNRIEDEDYPFLGIEVASDAAAVQQWEVEKIEDDGSRGKRRGKYVAVGVGGTPTGKGADFLIIDDPVKDQADADSPTVRESNWQWFKGTALTRLQPRGSVLLIGTRWHHDDLIGRILKEDQGVNRWKVMHFPAILPDGTSLDPNRWPIEELIRKRQEVGSRVWGAQYDGNPTPDEGAMLKREWFPMYTSLPPGVLYTIQSWDTAFKVGPKNDFSVCHTYAVTVYGLFLISRFKGQLEFPDLYRECLNQFAIHKPKYVLIEDKASGQSLVQSVIRDTKIPAIAVPVPAGEGKIKRVADASPHLEAKRVHLPEWGAGIDDLLTELTSFPLGEHDDEVDAMMQAVLREFGSSEAPPLRSESYIQDDEEDQEGGPLWRR
jgi:predicted phage terminase large subunit-like protein